MRRAFAETLNQLASENPRIIFLTGDLGFQVFDSFRERFGPRYVNVGVAEAQMVCAAAGLALEGWRPITYSIASFMTARAFEQIRVSVCYPQLPVLIVGAGGGYGYASSGVTHHAADDLALMSVLPGMTVIAPGDPNEVAQLLPQAMRLPGPAYFRIMGVGEPWLDTDAPIILGRARELRKGDRIAILCTGDISSIVMKAVDTLEPEKIFPAVYNIHTVKPLDSAGLDQIAERVEMIIVVEEHVPLGGLGAAVSAWMARNEKKTRLVRLGPPDALAMGNPRRTELQQRWHYDAKAIANACRRAWKDSSQMMGIYEERHASLGKTKPTGINL
jgi:transketolase